MTFKEDIPFTIIKITGEYSYDDKNNNYYVEVL